jgi:hypothetical protein
MNARDGSVQRTEERRYRSRKKMEIPRFVFRAVVVDGVRDLFLGTFTSTHVYGHM